MYECQTLTVEVIVTMLTFLLKQENSAADLVSMMILDSAPTILRAHPQYHLLLNAYLERDRIERDQQEEFSGWLSRVNSVEGIETELMSRIHGKLISHGLLIFELGDRMEGIRYQLSDVARRALKQLAEAGDAPELSDDLDAEDEELALSEDEDLEDAA